MFLDQIGKDTYNLRPSRGSVRVAERMVLKVR
ncbi:MAG: hypothetical protein ACI934_000527, partial [Pseudohongiellaceae bacterium]